MNPDQQHCNVPMTTSVADPGYGAFLTPGSDTDFNQLGIKLTGRICCDPRDCGLGSYSSWEEADETEMA